MLAKKLAWTGTKVSAAAHHMTAGKVRALDR